jgi:hypothetical protein
MEIGAPRRRAEEIGVKGYLKETERDRDRWLDGVRDIHEHDLRIWELGQNSQCITTWTFSFSSQDCRLVSLRFDNTGMVVMVMLMLIVRIKT